MTRVHTFRDRIAEWAARHHRADLLAGIHAYLEDRSKDEHAVMSAVSFALLAPPPGEPSLIERYAAQAGRLPRAERVLLQQWEKTWFSVMRVHDVLVDSWVEVHDVLRGRTLRIQERAATHQIEIGTWLAGFYFEVERHWEFEGTIRVVVPQARIHTVQAALRAYAEAGVDPHQVTPAESRHIARATMKGLHRGSRPPRLVNADGHDIVMVTSTLDLPWDEVTAVLKGWPDASIDEDSADVLGSEPVEATGGPSVRAVFAVDDGAVTLFTNSRERHDAMLARWQQSTGQPLAVKREDVQEAPSDRQGSPVMVDSTRMDLPADGDGETLAQQMVEDNDEQWPDLALPALGGLTPHEAVLQGRLAEVWALLSEDERGDEIAEVLGLAVPDPEQG